MKQLTENDFVLLLGSNVGNSSRHLADAIYQLSQRAGGVREMSSIHITAPWGKTDQADFANQAVIVRSYLPPLAFLAEIQQIEKDLGRVREEKWGPRIIDIDIIFIGNTVIDLPELNVPHPLCHERLFVLAPLDELIPGFVHPLRGESVLEMMEKAKG